MNNTIPNVPRELTIERDVFGAMHIKLGDFDFIQIQCQYPYTDNASTRALADRIAAMLSAPSPAGVDGLEVVGHIDSDDDVSGSYAVFKNDCDLRDGTELVRLSDAKAIIYGLRGEVERLQFSLEVAKTDELSAAVYAETESIKHSLWDAEKERDQQAQRICELAELAAQANVNCKNTAYYLRKYRPDLADICSGWCAAIDAALSAGKEGE